MALSTYSELKTAVASWLKADDLTDFIPDLIRMGELRIYRDLRIRAMEATLSGTVASGVVAVPDGYVELKYAYVTGAPIAMLTKKDAEWVHYNYPFRSSDGKPRFIARDGDNFVFGPHATDGQVIAGTYYKRLDALSTSNETNWFTTNAADLLLFATLCEAEPFVMNDARIPTWERKYEFVKQRIQSEDQQEDFSGSPLSMSAR
jgi:hypothetical protein